MSALSNLHDPGAAPVEQHLGLVYHLATQLARRYRHVDVRELVGAGTLGLIDAAARFDPARGLRFATFATPRIRGAMLDELRQLTPDAAGEACPEPPAFWEPAPVHEALAREQERAALAEGIRALGARERTVLALYYFEELRLHQIATVLGVSESRVSQIHARAITALRRHMGHLRDGRAHAAGSPSRRRASVSVGSSSS